MPEELRNSTSKDEIARQEAIYEFVYSEEDYNKDLNVLHEASDCFFDGQKAIT